MPALVQGVSEEALKGVFEEIRSLFGKFDAELDLAEFVVVGKPNCGKNVFIKAFTGFEIFSSKFEVTGVRFPIKLILHHSPNLKTPVWNGHISSSRKNLGDEEKSSDMDALRRFLEAETATQPGIDFSREITINIWGSTCSDFTLINTPELDTASTLPAQIQLSLRNGLRSLMASENRTIICIVDCASEDWTASDVVELCKTTDSRLARTVFVATGVKDKLQEFFSKDDAEAFLRGPNRPDSTFTMDLSGFSLDIMQPSAAAPSSIAHTKPATRVTTARRAVGERERDRSQSTPVHSVTTSAKPATSMEVFLAMLNDKDQNLKKTFSNLNLSPQTINEHVGFFALKDHLKDMLMQKLLSNVPTLVSLLDKKMRAIRETIQETDVQIRRILSRPQDFAESVCVS